MAYCRWVSVIKESVGQSKLIHYTGNKRKTRNIEYGKSAQERLIDYTTNESKTSNEEWRKGLFIHPGEDTAEEKEFYVTGMMCTKENAHRRMLACQKMSDKKIINLAYHGLQSFREGPEEMTPEDAHEIGVRLAKELWGDFMVLVSTHLNTGHFHNHFVICSTSPITGRRFNKSNKTLKEMRDKSDELCLEYGLNVIKERTNAKAKSQAEIAMAKKHIPTHKELLKMDIDIAIEQSSDWNGFLESLKRMGYKIKYNNKSVSVNYGEWQRAIRINYTAGENKDRGLGLEYTKERIVQRIEESVRKRQAEKAKENQPETKYLYKAKSKTENSEDSKEKQNAPPKYRGTFSDNPKDFAADLNKPLPTMPKYRFKGRIRDTVPYAPAGLRITYYRLSYKMCILPKPYKKNQKKRMSLYMRSELNKLHRYIDEVNFLANTGIKTMTQLNTYKEYAVSQMSTLENERQTLRNKLRRCTDEPTVRNIKSSITDLTSQISVLRKEIRICSHIAENTENVRYKVNEDSRQEAQQLKQNEQNKTKNKFERKYEL